MKSMEFNESKIHPPKNKEELPKTIEESVDEINNETTGLQLEKLPPPAIHVDREKIFSELPADFSNFLNPELQNIGPAEFRADELDISNPGWTKKREKNASGEVATHKDVYDFLMENGLLSKALDLQDLEAIKSKGMDFFDCHFHDWGWKPGIDMTLAELRNVLEYRVQIPAYKSIISRQMESGDTAFCVPILKIIGSESANTELRLEIVFDEQMTTGSLPKNLIVPRYKEGSEIKEHTPQSAEEISQKIDSVKKPNMSDWL